MIRKIFEDPRLPTEYPFKVAVAIYAKRLAIFLAVAVVSFLVGLLLCVKRAIIGRTYRFVMRRSSFG